MFCYRACLKSCLPSLHKIYTHSLQQLETCKQDSVWRTSRVKLWHRPHHWELHVTGQAGHLSKLAHTLSAETFLARLIFSQRKLLNIQYIYMNSAKTGQTILQSQSLIFGLSLSRNVRNSAGCGGGESRRGPANCLFCQLFWVIGNNETRAGYWCPGTAGWQPTSAVPNVNQNILINQFLFIVPLKESQHFYVPLNCSIFHILTGKVNVK